MTRWFRKAGSKPYVVMPTIAALIFSGWFVVQARGAGSANNDANPTEQVVSVTSGTMAKTVSAQGTVAATVSDTLGANGAPSSSSTGSSSGTGRSANNLGDGSNGNGASTAAVALISLDAYKVSLGFDANDIGSIASAQSAKIALSTASSN